MRHLYRKLAWTNIRNNKQFYLPYLLTGILSAMMFYCMRAMQGNEGVMAMRGAGYIQFLLTMGVVVIGIFVCIFLFYTNSFIMKRRKRELGIYNILGMEKKHIAGVMFLETLFTFAVSVGGGLVTGILFNKLLQMFLYRLIGSKASIPFYISGMGCLQTVQLFGAIYAATFLYDFMQIQTANPAELLRGGSVGEREPKTKVFMTVAGIVCIIGAYTIAAVTKNPGEVVLLFFPAVVLVIIGTYSLFTSGSIAFLKALRKNKNYYYQTRHFTTVSGMLYRMKQNAVGLANICILSTMVLVMISTTVSMYAGVKDELQERYPAELNVALYYDSLPDSGNLDGAYEELKKGVTDSGRMITAQSREFALNFTAEWDGAVIETGKFSDEVNMKELSYVKVMTKADYERDAAEQLPELGDGEVVLISCTAFDGTSVRIDGKEYRVAEVREMDADLGIMQDMVSGYLYFIVKDGAAMEEIYENLREVYTAAGRDVPSYRYDMELDIDGTPEEKIACAAVVREQVDGWKESRAADIGGFDYRYFESRQEGYEDFLSLNGGLFFLGLFLGAMFLMVTVLIIYYKQISEGYDDKERYGIMERVGMSSEEVKASINAQVRLVFFLPLAAAVIHLAAAFPMLKRLLGALNLTNVPLFVGCLCGTVLVFGFIYLLVFKMTSRSYYRIVGEQV